MREIETELLHRVRRLIQERDEARAVAGRLASCVELTGLCFVRGDALSRVLDAALGATDAVPREWWR